MKYLKFVLIAVAVCLVAFVAITYNGGESAGSSNANSTPAGPYFKVPGDVTIVTDGNDFRLRLESGQIGTEVFGTKQEAIDYINKMHSIMNPAEGKSYQPAQ